MKNISKKVISLEEGVEFGYVIDIAYDESGLNKIGYYVVEDESESEFLLLNENIFSIGEYIVVENFSYFQFVAEKIGGLISKAVLDEFGNFYGNVEKVLIERNRITKIETDRCEICRKNIMAVKKGFILVGFKRKKHVDRKKENVFKTENVERNVSIQNLKSYANIPQKVNLSASYYVGKTSKSDVFGYNNERVVVMGEKITKTIFENVKKHNKLNELFFVIDN